MLLLKANHERNEFIFNNEKMILNPGQLIIGRKELSRVTGIHESTIQRVLKYLESEHQIEQQTNPKYRIITIKRWWFYQQVEQHFEQQMNNSRTTSEQQVNTNKNDKNEKNEKNYRVGSFEKDDVTLPSGLRI